MNIKFEAVSKKVYHKTILDKCSFMLEMQGVIGLLGPNSLETTTILRLLSGTILPSSGKIQIDYQPLQYHHRQQIAYIDNLRMFPSDSDVRAVIQTYQVLFPDFDRKRCRQLCEQLAIDLAWPLSSLTRGMEASILIALTLSRKTRVYVFNEPFGGVDFLSRERILAILQRYREKHTTFIVSTNHIELAQQLFDHVIFIKNGKMYREYQLQHWEETPTIIDKYREVYE
ncbi:MAG: ATP-binding cassette domain-containing protein [Culicoidibacterales bacterium]